MPRPTPLSGFPELLPGERIVEQHLLDELRRVFELHGFASVQTRAAETMDQLLRKGEIDKEVYVLRRLQAGDDDVDDPSDRQLGLHFDLTVPFARYVLENAGRLQFPFRRYQIQPVWRGERPQEGRYREFWQADIDVVDAETLAPHHDAEVTLVMAEALAALPLPPMRMQVNNRKLIEGFYLGIGVRDVPGVMREVDRLDRAGAAAVAAALADDVGLDDGQVRACLALAEIRGTGSVVESAVAALGVAHPLLEEGLGELLAVLRATEAVRGDRVSVEGDLRIARGLDYYTGTVYETRMAGFEQLGSVCSGGRYDALASDGRTTYPGVGISFGVTRALVPLLARGVLAASRPTPTCVVVAVVDEDRRAESDAVAAALRARGIPTEVSPSAAKFGRQIRYADRRSIPFVWFPASSTVGGGHEVKDIRSGDQTPADPTTWQPPAADHHPTVQMIT